MSKNTREIIRQALERLKQPGPHDLSKEPIEAVTDIIHDYLREQHAQMATAAEIEGLSPIEFFYLMYPNPTDDDGPLSY